MNPVARFEALVERIMERTLTRATRSRLQPVEIAKRLARVMDADQVVGALGVRVPNIFDVELSPSDFDQLKPIRGSVTAEIEAYLARTARDRLYILASAPVVRVRANEHLQTGEIGVRAQMEDIHPAQAIADDGSRAASPVAQYTQAMPSVPNGAPSVAPRHHASRLMGDGTEYTLHSAPIAVGRAPENDLVLEDRRVSRRHARLMQSGGHWSVTDLESKNGTALNGRVIEEARLRDGDQLSFGGVELVFEE